MVGFSGVVMVVMVVVVVSGLSVLPDVLSGLWLSLLLLKLLMFVSSVVEPVWLDGPMKRYGYSSLKGSRAWPRVPCVVDSCSCSCSCDVGKFSCELSGPWCFSLVWR